MEGRKGRQDPTNSLILPYRTTEGDIAVKLYNLTGRTALPWQVLESGEKDHLYVR